MIQYDRAAHAAINKHFSYYFFFFGFINFLFGIHALGSPVAPAKLKLKPKWKPKAKQKPKNVKKNEVKATKML